MHEVVLIIPEKKEKGKHIKRQLINNVTLSWQFLSCKLQCKYCSLAVIGSHADHKQLKLQWLSSKQDSISSVSPVKLIKFIALGSQPQQAALIKASHPANGPDSDQLGLFPTACILHFFQCLWFQTPTFLISRLQLYNAWSSQDFSCTRLWFEVSKNENLTVTLTAIMGQADSKAMSP